jgi:hypothetical protein
MAKLLCCGCTLVAMAMTVTVVRATGVLICAGDSRFEVNAVGILATNVSIDNSLQLDR